MNLPPNPSIAFTNQLLGDVKRNWGWLLAQGIVLAILGLIGILFATPLFTVVSIFLFGILLIIASVPQFAICAKAKSWQFNVFHILVGLLYLYAGIIAVVRPLAASAIITFMIACFLLAAGAVRIIQALQHRGIRGWSWLLVSGVIAIIMGLIIMTEWPISGLWVIGLFVAVELLFSGLAAINIALAAKNLPLDVAAEK